MRRAGLSSLKGHKSPESESVIDFAIINVIVDNDDQHLYLISLSHLLFKNIGYDGCFRNLVFVIVSD